MSDLVNSTSNIPLAHFRAALANPKAEKRIDALISADNAAEQVAALAVSDLYFLIEEVGLADCVELLSLCTNDQIRGCIDMEIWDRDLPQIEAFLPWLATLQENGFEFLGRVWAGIDQELAALTLASLCQIYDKSLGEEVPDEEEREYFDTPDTFFSVVLITDDQVQDKLVHSIIEDLYRSDMQMARHTLMSARSEPKAELEEMSYRWRSGRMADLGYVDFYQALEVFRPLDPSSIQIGEDSAGELEVAQVSDETPLASALPALVIESVVGRSFFVKALEQIDDATTAQNLQSSLLYLVNRVMSAGRLSPGQPEALKLAALHATATVALGLEYVSDGSVDKAADALRSISMSRLHRVGYTLCLRMARFARMIAPRAMNADARTLCVLEAVLAKRPFFPVILDDPSKAEMRAIESLADLRKIANYLSDLALRVAVADALGAELVAGETAPSPDAAKLDDYVRTALVRKLLGGELQAAPLSPSELAEFHKLVNLGLSEGVRDRAASGLVELLDEAGVVEARSSLSRLIAQWFTGLEESFAALPTNTPIDPRFIEGILCIGNLD